MQNLLDPRIFPYLLTITLCLANAISYFCYRAYHFAIKRDYGQGTLQVWSAAHDRKMAYLIAGPLNQPHVALKFALPDLITSGVTMVKYQNSGYDTYQMARQIYNDIEEHDYDATIYAVSAGDQVARWLTYWLGPDVRTIAINPCSTPKFLRHPTWICGSIVAVLLQMLNHLLGWLSLIPCIPTHSGWYSIQLLADQLEKVVDGDALKTECEFVPPDGFLVDMHSKFMRNSKITETYSEAPCIIMMKDITDKTKQHSDELLRHSLQALLDCVEKEAAKARGYHNNDFANA